MHEVDEGAIVRAFVFIVIVDRKCGMPVIDDYDPDPRYREDDGYYDDDYPDDEYYDEDDYYDDDYEPRRKSKVWIPIVIVAAVLALAAVGIFVVLPMLRDHKPSQAVEEQVDKPQTENGGANTSGSAPENTTTIAEPETTTQAPVVAVPDYQQSVSVFPSGGGYRLTLETWTQEGGWQEVFSCSAKLAPGITPKGEYRILYVVGANQPATNLRFRSVSPGDIWVGDPNSSFYNTLQKGTSPIKDWTSGEDIYRDYFAPDAYCTAGIFFDYNGDGETAHSASPGGPSVIFLFGRKDYDLFNWQTGDIMIYSGDMTTLLSYLDSSKNPRINITY